MRGPYGVEGKEDQVTARGSATSQETLVVMTEARSGQVCLSEPLCSINSKGKEGDMEILSFPEFKPLRPN